MKHKIALNKKPHELEVGDELVFLFKPEVMGDDLVDSYGELMDAQARMGDRPTPDDVRASGKAVRELLSSFMLDESADLFAATPLPDRVLSEMLDWVLSLYGARPTGRSADSSQRSIGTQRRSTGSARSKG